MGAIRIDIPDKLAFLASERWRYKCLFGGRGSGKSWTVARSLLGLALASPIRILCAREFQSSIKESVHQLLGDQIRAIGADGMFEVLAHEIRGRNGSYISYAGLHDSTIDSIKSYEGYDICWVEEGHTMSAHSWKILKPTIRKPGSEIWVTMNPENDDDPLYQDLVINPPDNCKSVLVNWYDNPWLTKELLEEKDNDYRSNPEDARWIWGGETRKISDAQVLKGKIQVEPFEPRELWDGPYQGMDFGFATDPTALVRCWVNDDCLYIRNEVYGEGAETDDLPALMDCMDGSREHVTRADCSRPETISYLKRHGFPRVMECRKWPGSVEDGVRFLRSFHRIVIHPDCQKIIREAKLWKFKTNKAGDVLPQLASGNDHGWDAVRYALEGLIMGHVKRNPAPKPAPEVQFVPFGGKSSWQR
jgi:phage terminase large subunit